MEERVRELLGPAFRRVPAREANLAISRARRERAGGDPDDDDAPTARSYEMVLTTWQVFAAELLPKLVYHLESVGAHLPECRGVLISAFVGDELYFIDAREFVAAACRILGVTTDELVANHGTGERRTALRKEPLLLPGPRGRN